MAWIAPLLSRWAAVHWTVEEEEECHHCHGTLRDGLSLGPGTGKLISEIVLEEKTSIPLEAFDPERYDR